MSWRKPTSTSDEATSFPESATSQPIIPAIRAAVTSTIENVDGALPPRQHDDVGCFVGRGRRGDVGGLVRHPQKSANDLPPTATVRFRYRREDDPTVAVREVPGDSGGEPVTLVDVQEVTVRFGGIVALDCLTFGIETGHICGLIGPNGAGKTTMFNVVSRIYEPTSGRVTYDGKDLLAVPAHGIAALGIARTFQNLALFPSMSLLENVMVGAHSQGDVGVAQAISRIGVAAENRRTRDFAGDLLARARPRSADVPAGRRVAVRHAQATRDRQGVGRPTALPADGRAGVGSHPRRGRRTRRDDPADPRRVRPHRAARRAPHVDGDGDLRPGRGDGVRPQDRRGRSRRSAERPDRHRGLPGERSERATLMRSPATQAVPGRSSAGASSLAPVGS